MNWYSQQAGGFFNVLYVSSAHYSRALPCLTDLQSRTTNFTLSIGALSVYAYFCTSI
ncbi:unknown [Bacteroides sp. CAG:462]|nr:unknown [Bacteroides sp. CAG:462]